MSSQPRGIEQFLDALEIRVEAFGVCEIGRQFSLQCDAFDSVVVHFVLQGEGFLDCRHGRFPLSEGTAIVVPSELAKNLNGAGPIQHVVRADAACSDAGDLVRFAASDGQVDLVLGCATLSRAIAGDLPLFAEAKRPIIESSRDPLLKTLFSMMFDEVRNPRLGTGAFVSALMKQVLIVMLRAQPDDVSSILLMSGDRLAGVVAEILDRPEDDHSVSRLAALAGMSRSRFIHHFTNAYNTTPRAFVQTARLAAAARMLRSTDLPVKSIAASVGYASRSHFTRAFQAKFGRDPSTFRVQGSSDPESLPRAAEASVRPVS